MNRRAFTLIELLVVIAIIAILAAILFPVFAQAKAAAKKTQDLSNMKNIATATIMYQGDNDDVYQMLRNGVRDWGCVRAAQNPCEQINNGANATNPYIKNRDIWKSPQDSLPHPSDPYGNKSLGGVLSYVFTYNNKNTELTNGSFGLMGWDSANSATGAPGASFTPSLNGSQVDSSAGTILLVPLYCTWSYWNGLMQYRADSRWLAYDTEGATRAGATSNLTLYISNYPKFDDYGSVWNSDHDGMSMGSWGGKTTNFAFADGHAKAMNRESTIDPMWLRDAATAAQQGKKNLFHYSGQYK